GFQLKRMGCVKEAPEAGVVKTGAGSPAPAAGVGLGTGSVCCPCLARAGQEPMSEIEMVKAIRSDVRFPIIFHAKNGTAILRLKNSNNFVTCSRWRCSLRTFPLSADCQV